MCADKPVVICDSDGQEKKHPNINRHADMYLLMLYTVLSPRSSNVVIAVPERWHFFSWSCLGASSTTTALSQPPAVAIASDPVCVPY